MFSPECGGYSCCQCFWSLRVKLAYNCALVAALCHVGTSVLVLLTVCVCSIDAVMCAYHHHWYVFNAMQPCYIIWGEVPLGMGTAVAL